MDAINVLRRPDAIDAKAGSGRPHRVGSNRSTRLWEPLPARSLRVRRSDTPAAAQTTPATELPPALEAFARAWSGVTAYRAKVDVFAEKGADVQNIGFNYDFRKPAAFTVHVIDGPNAGVTLTWDGGPTVQAARGGGGLFARLFKRTLALHDPLVTTVRGASLEQLSYGAILAHAEQTPGTLAQRPRRADRGHGHRSPFAHSDRSGRRRRTDPRSHRYLDSNAASATRRRI